MAMLFHKYTIIHYAALEFPIVQECVGGKEKKTSDDNFQYIRARACRTGNEIKPGDNKSIKISKIACL